MVGQGKTTRQKRMYSVGGVPSVQLMLHSCYCCFTGAPVNCQHGGSHRVCACTRQVYESSGMEGGSICCQSAAVLLAVAVALSRRLLYCHARSLAPSLSLPLAARAFSKMSHTNCHQQKHQHPLPILIGGIGRGQHDDQQQVAKRAPLSQKK